MAVDPAPVWRLDVSIPAAAVPAFEAALSELGGAIATDAPEAGAEVGLQVYLDAEPGRPRLDALLAGAALRAGVSVPEARVARLPDVDWVTESHRALPAIQAGPFYIHGSHVKEPAPSGAIPILIEAGPAFGTGRHESTLGCLLALADLAKVREPTAAPAWAPAWAPTHALDMGCGSGLLAIAIAKLWGCPVRAVDTDPEAVREAAGNATANGVGARVSARRGEGYDANALGTNASFDLIVANILAAPLRAMAPDLKRHLAPGGVAVLSGLLEDQADAVIAAHRPLRILRRLPLGGWLTLVLEA
jgi:ribosomal protein L11 methyltransferase